MNLQYIGARYVPKFYENPDTGDITWKSGVNYEPLTVVKYNDDTYTSKIPVPSEIGNPADNGTYWAKTADFNAALHALQENIHYIEDTELPAIRSDISENTDKINEINGRPRYLLFGDSYALGTGAGSSYGWTSYVKDKLGLTEGVDVFTYAAGGIGFVGWDGTFQSLLNNAISEIDAEVRSTITDIIVMGGHNDMRIDSVPYDNIVTAIQTFISTAKSNFSRAKITIGFAAPWVTWHTTNANTANNALTTQNAWMDGASNGARFVPRIYDVLFSRYTYMSDDRTHPTAAGYTELNKQILNVILGGEPVHDFTLGNATFTADTDITVSGLNSYFRRTVGSMCIQFVGEFSLSNKSGDSYQSPLKLGHMDVPVSVLTGHISTRSSTVPVYVYHTSGRRFAMANITIDYKGDIYLQLMSTISGSRDNWSDITQVNIINASEFNLIIDYEVM